MLDWRIGGVLYLSVCMSVYLWLSVCVCLSVCLSIKSFDFYDIILSRRKYMYIKNSMCVWSWINFKKFHPLVIVKIWACILRVGVLPHVALSRKCVIFSNIITFSHSNAYTCSNEACDKGVYFIINEDPWGCLYWTGIVLRSYDHVCVCHNHICDNVKIVWKH